MKILETSENILSFSGLGHLRAVPIAGFGVPRRAIQAVIVSAMVLCLLMQTMVIATKCVQGLDAIIIPIYFWLTYASAILIYASLMAKLAEITELIHFIRNVMARSEWDGILANCCQSI